MSKLSDELKRKKRKKIPKDKKRVTIDDPENESTISLDHFKNHKRSVIVDPHRSLRIELSGIDFNT